jgi:hypothetical protein
MAGRIRMRADAQAGKDGQAGEPAAASALAQLGWGDVQRRLVVLRLDEPQWQVLQRVVMHAAAVGRRCGSTEALLTACLEEWLESKE